MRVERVYALQAEDTESWATSPRPGVILELDTCVLAFHPDHPEEVEFFVNLHGQTVEVW